jgi:hypothetical protein
MMSCNSCGTDELPCMTRCVLGSRLWISSRAPVPRSSALSDRQLGPLLLHGGQEGVGGTPFPYVISLHVTAKDQLVVVCRLPDSWQVFWFAREGTLLYRVEIDGAHLPVAREMKVFDQKGQPIGTVVYNDYRFPGPRAGETTEPAASVPYPGRLTLVGADGKRSMQMDIEEMNVNTPVESKHFDVPLPDNGRIESLGEVLRSGKSPW